MQAIDTNINEKDLCLYVSLTARDDKGKIFYRQIEYGISKILLDYAFAPISEDDIYSFEQLEAIDKNAQMKKKKYNHFDKIYEIPSKTANCKGEKMLEKFYFNADYIPTQDILSEEEIVGGNETGAKRLSVDLENAIASNWYGKDRTKKKSHNKR